MSRKLMKSLNADGIVKIEDFNEFAKSIRSLESLAWDLRLQVSNFEYDLWFSVNELSYSKYIQVPEDIIGLHNQLSRLITYLFLENEVALNEDEMSDFKTFLSTFKNSVKDYRQDLGEFSSSYNENFEPNSPESITAIPVAWQKFQSESEDFLEKCEQFFLM